MTEAEQKTAKKRAKRYQSINLSCIKILIKFIKYDIKNRLKQKMNKKKKNPNVAQTKNDDKEEESQSDANSDEGEEIDLCEKVTENVGKEIVAE